MEERKNKWCSPTMMETPFYYSDITQDEYEEEMEYLMKQTPKDMITYKPLWKQRDKGNN